MSVTDAVIAVPKYEIDKVMHTKVLERTWPDSVLNSGFTYNTGLRTFALPIAVFSVDGGDSWSDTSPPFTGSGFTLDPNPAVNITMNGAGVASINITQKALINGGNPYQLLVKAAFLALPTQTNIPAGLDRGSTLYSSQQKHMKIFKQDSLRFDAAGNLTEVITHNLGYEPMVAVWSQNDFGSGSIERMISFMGNEGADSEDGVKINENTVTIFASGFGTAPGANFRTIHYKIYYEQ